MAVTQSIKWWWPQWQVVPVEVVVVLCLESFWGLGQDNKSRKDYSVSLQTAKMFCDISEPLCYHLRTTQVIELNTLYIPLHFRNPNVFSEPSTNQKHSRCPCMNFKSQVCLSCAVCKGRHATCRRPLTAAKTWTKWRTCRVFAGWGHLKSRPWALIQWAIAGIVT